MESFWYVIKVMPGRERKLNEQFNQQIQTGKIENINRFICPTEHTSVSVKDKKIVKEKVLYSGYLYFESLKRLNDSELKYISGFEGIMGMMGDKTPLLVRNEEVEKILKDDALENHLESKRIKLIKGDEVLVLEGPFQTFHGIVNEIRDNKVEINVKIFGRDTSVSLTLDQIEKVR
jgi:transcriptional antiterminator NusG